ncbi:tRNA-splicing endonuclease subunit Sen34 isoform c [Mus musculus]|uniref:tRNA-splicing endonuclease subunit Sen34 isoform c n=1 Tax=Mus musculus TaxID=10090 RepID=UPI00244E8623|nr:tRNA-splicing endonuclease subunit Sen34 isoform c [Mus musculus]
MLVVEVANGRSLVWGAEAVQALRERLGVGGRTVGALPRGPRQNSRLGLPLLLLPEEARLLAEIGAVTLVSAPRPDPRNHGLALASFKRQQEQSFQDQNTLAAEARETRRQELLEKIVEGQAAKKQKLEQDSGADEGGQEAGGSEATQGSETSDDGQPSAEQEGAAPSLDSSSPQPGPSNGVTPLPRSALLIQLATARPRPVKAKPLDWRVQSKDWPHAGRPAHELRYSIYRDLWERGFFLSAAGKFGGDFLVIHCVSMLTTLLSAGLLRTPSHFRTWSLQAAWEPVSGRPCCSAPLSLMGRWSTHPCSGPACSELETVCGKNPLQWSPQLISARRLALSCSAWFVPIPGF